jgi:hypothetical protein
MNFECEHAKNGIDMNIFMGGHINGFLFNESRPPDCSRRE